MDHAPHVLQARDSTILQARDSTSCPDSISGGGIAGIVIGTIVGTLLIIWLLRVCSLPGAWGDGKRDYGYSSSGGGGGGGPVEVRTSHRRRRSSPSYMDYVEKPSRSRRYRGEVRRPAKVYLS
ncbi:uncharacterized protein ACLA_037190 [Aspergillus clavatus NRRL 1]|uniref:Uncharacterized protein n=1 Tax=Aspergillus clavatus (strain ATCC 1007 / CBS 513.65 / DSM 816 / NCTC 3887 / NRRL 1 / QM 1276 / 107) TaxID=344612 RepID=A1CK38_ASPCL|nr:uncharacterized protein ACLA_037190 [Aspergillus clavatus NRRL 1]EAW09512.1 conserved hypothetical protein [Aspergillus clavatus NRRL 1]